MGLLKNSSDESSPKQQSSIKSTVQDSIIHQEVLYLYSDHSVGVDVVQYNTNVLFITGRSVIDQTREKTSSIQQQELHRVCSIDY